MHTYTRTNTCTYTNTTCTRTHRQTHTCLHPHTANSRKKMQPRMHACEHTYPLILQALRKRLKPGHGQLAHVAVGKLHHALLHGVPPDVHHLRAQAAQQHNHTYSRTSRHTAAQAHACNTWEVSGAQKQRPGPRALLLWLACVLCPRALLLRPDRHILSGQRACTGFAAGYESVWSSGFTATPPPGDGCPSQQPTIKHTHFSMPACAKPMT